MTNCIFCKIINRKIDTELLCDYEHSVAFRAKDPVAPTHIIVTPRLHCEYMEDCLSHEITDLIRTAVDVGERFAPNGFRIVSNVGDDSGQQIKHVHVHVIGGRKLGDIG